MAVSFVVIIGMLGIPALLVVVVVAIVLLGRRSDPAPSQAAEVARRHGAAVNAIAWAVAILLNPFLLAAIPLFRVTGGAGLYTGILAGLYPTSYALTFLAVHAIGERTWPRPTGTVRRAGLAPRGFAAPRWLLRVTLALALTLVVTLTVTGLTADGGSRIIENGRSYASPFPGWYYGLPLLVGTAATLLATWGVLHLIARRPAVVDADPEYDAAARRLSGHRVLRGTQLTVALTLGGVLIVAGQAVDGGMGAALVGLGILAALGGIGVAVVPARPLVPQAPRQPMTALPPQPGAAPTAPRAGQAR